MKSQTQKDLDYWRQRISDDGIAPVGAESLSNLAPNSKVAAIAAVAEYEENQASERHKEQLESGKKTHKLQRIGNNVQWGVLGVLFLTLLVSVSTCRGG